MAAIFVSQNNETAAMFVSQTSPVGVELFSYGMASGSFIHALLLFLSLFSQNLIN